MDEPELTARKFVIIDGNRLYRTGDLIVKCTDGEYQFIGRVDRQFKLRGMLVEPEEIEARLALRTRRRPRRRVETPTKTEACQEIS